MFLQISQNEWINSEEIVHIAVADEMNCILTTEAGVFTANYPIQTLLSLLKEQSDVEDKEEVDVLKQMNEKIGNLSIFAG